MKFVIDTSVAVKWFLPEMDHDAAVALLGTDAIFLAPDLIFTEFASAMQKKIRLGETDLSQAAESCASLPRLFESIVPTLLLFQRALDIALAIAHPVPDCVFLAAAEQNGVRIVSADRKLVEKANERGFSHLVFGLSEAIGAISLPELPVSLPKSDLRDIARLNDHLEKTFKELGGRHISTGGRFHFVPSEVYSAAFDSPAYVRLRRTIESMPPHQMRDLVALCWLGRGYEGTDWLRLRERAETAIGYTPSKVSYVLSCLVDLQAGIDRVLTTDPPHETPHRDP